MYNIKEIQYSEWLSYTQQIGHINLLQHWHYGSAKEQAGPWKSIRFAILDENYNLVALAQVLVITAPFFGGIARMNRGPILKSIINQFDRETVSSNAINTLLKEAKKRRWWFIQIAPELIQSDNAEKVLEETGLRKLNSHPSASGLILLSHSEEDLLMGFKGKWRNCLKKGLRLGVVVSIKSGDSTALNSLISRYDELQNNKGFQGMSDSLIKSLANQHGKDWEFTLFIANENGNTGVKNSVGMLVSIKHGDTSTYFIGSTNDKGRTLQANYVLLWEAILYAKKHGCIWFDIGGLNKTTPLGVAHFKNGLRSELYSLVGEWRGFLNPFS
jgi:lipid II:glycine glycyltransferase (peptidoglycan interpeptide bridge formation enzyme)